MQWLKTGRRALALGAGLLAGTSLLYSQEFGLAFLLSAAAGFAVTRAGRAAAAFVLGAGAVLVPVLGWFAAQGALGPMLSDVVEYPRYMLAGYAKRPFPSLVASLPLRLAALQDPETLLLRLGYSAPFLCAAALLIAVPVAALSLRHPLVWVRGAAETLARDPLRLAIALLALFGALSFRSALGRSDLIHVLMILAPPALLVVVGIDRLISAWIAEPARRGLVATRAVALVLLVLLSGLLEKAQPVLAVRYSLALPRAARERRVRAPRRPPRATGLALGPAAHGAGRAGALPAGFRLLLLFDAAPEPDPVRAGTPDRDRRTPGRGLAGAARAPAALHRLGRRAARGGRDRAAGVPGRARSSTGSRAPTPRRRRSEPRACCDAGIRPGDRIRVVSVARPNRRYQLALWIDRRLGPLLCVLLVVWRRIFAAPAPLPAPESVSKILVLKLWGMGSIVLASPLLERLRERHPQARIDFLTLRENAAILDADPAARPAHHARPRRRHPGFSGRPR